MDDGWQDFVKIALVGRRLNGYRVLGDCLHYLCLRGFAGVHRYLTKAQTEESASQQEGIETAEWINKC